ncbi:MAG TPA: hypothetical protein VF037_02855 [Gemmatimonadales bacterium]
MARRPASFAWLLGTVAAAAVLVVGGHVSGEVERAGWQSLLPASALYAAALVGLGVVMLARTRRWQAAALLAAATVWGIGWLAPALAVSRVAGAGSMLGMVGAGIIELPVAALLGLWVFLRYAGWQHPRSESGGHESRRAA